MSKYLASRKHAMIIIFNHKKSVQIKTIKYPKFFGNVENNLFKKNYENNGKQQISSHVSTAFMFVFVVVLTIYY
jgi:UDP-N-acetylglucosamine enolpyruvyl transferase